MENAGFQRLIKLRQYMKEEGISLFLILHSDAHMSEYVSEADSDIEYLTGFSGENCTVAVTQTESHLWTDGRFFIQAEKEMLGSGTDLFRSGEDGVPKVEEFLKSHVNEGETVSCDGRRLSRKLFKKYDEAIKEKNGIFDTSSNVMDKVFSNRPKLPSEKLFILKDEFSGKSASDKLSDVRKHMKEKKADIFFLSSLCDIAWLLNLRGNDIPCTPVFYSFLLLSMDEGKLFINEEAVSKEIRDYLEGLNIKLCPYESVYDALSEDRGKAVLLDSDTVNERIYESFGEGTNFIEEINCTEVMKAVKNETEIKNTKKAHVIDAVAMCRFLYEIKTGKIDIEKEDEYTIGEILYRLREEGEGYIEPSFPTIAAYGENAALMHYTATPEMKSPLQKRGFLLVDSGGTYFTGTTDITRTIALGELTKKEREDFTLVLKSSLRLMRARFLDGTTGQNLDILARGVMWERGLDYKCGTGHGVGHVLAVHEGPNSIRWKIENAPDFTAHPLKPGMITTDEPGLYFEGEYGIRIENELLCVEDIKNEYGRYYSFENITLVPIDLDAIEPSMLTEEEKDQLNAYHEEVRKTIAPLLNEDEAKWLSEATRAVE